MTDEIADLLELVLSSIAEADGHPRFVLRALALERPEARVFAVIRTLIAAETSLRETFKPPEDALFEADLAKASALLLSELADEHEAGRPQILPLMLKDLEI